MRGPRRRGDGGGVGCLVARDGEVMRRLGGGSGVNYAGESRRRVPEKDVTRNTIQKNCVYSILYWSSLTVETRWASPYVILVFQWERR